MQFADGTVDVALLLDQPFDRLNITFTDGDVGHPQRHLRRASTPPAPLPCNGSPSAPTASGRNMAGATAPKFTPGAALAGVEVRVVAIWTSTLPRDFGPQTTASVETGIVGTAAVDDDITGSAGPT